MPIESAMDGSKLHRLTVTEYNLIANKDPRGSYDRGTRENLTKIIEKLSTGLGPLSPLEMKLYEKFHGAQFQALEEKDRRVKREVAKYRLSSGAKGWAKGIALATLVLVFAATVVYQLVLDQEARHTVDVAWYAQLNNMGLVSREELDRMQADLQVTETNLKKTKKDYEELAQTVNQMILNNKVTENLKYIIKQIHGNSRTKYIKKNGEISLNFDGREVARYETDPSRWYLLGIIESGVTRVYYNNDQILEIETIFGRKGEETPLGEYEIKNRVYKPTWYKKERKNEQVRVRAIPFGHPEHEIGYWWLGLKRLGDPVPGSYGIHGVNASKVNEFFKKNFDWRNGSAGCPNIQGWYLHFLAKVLPVGTRVNIVAEDKWNPSGNNGGQLVGAL